MLRQFHEYIMNLLLFLECVCVSTCEKVYARVRASGSVCLCAFAQAGECIRLSICVYVFTPVGESVCVLVFKIAHNPWQCVELGLQRFISSQ